MVNRCVDAVIGLQFGSEAKGKMMSVLGDNKYKALVRNGGCNSAHSAYANGKKFLFHLLPCGSITFPDAKLVLGANAQIDLEYLQKEINVLKENNCWLGTDGKPRLVIDKNAVLVNKVDKIAESGGKLPGCGELYSHPRDCIIHNEELHGSCIGCEKLSKDSAWVKLGSTTHGCGALSIRRILRGTKMAALAGQPFYLKKYLMSKLPEEMELDEFVMQVIENGPVTDWSGFVDSTPVEYADENEFTKPFVTDTVDLLNRMVDNNELIMLEGTQGILLSLYHGYRGKTTSRDTSVANWCAESGLSPLTVREVYGICRTYPIRVAGDSGHMGEEITWDDVTKFAESPEPIIEQTSATRRVRRVARFNDVDFRRALYIVRPTKFMLTFADYLHYSDSGKGKWEDLTEKSRKWITDLESKMNIHFDYISTGPKQEDTIFRVWGAAGR